MSTPAVVFTVAGHPQGKGRARAFIRAGHVAHYTPDATRRYESMIRGAAMDAMAGRPPIDVPVASCIKAIFVVPASWSQKKRAAALAGELRPGKKPDLDNIIKAVVDACNGVVFRDDALIVDSRSTKVYGPSPMVVVEVAAA